MKNLQGTFTTAQLDSKMLKLDYSDLKAMARKVVIGSQDNGHPKRWYERAMNRFGWYRQSEWYLIDSSKFMAWPTFDR
jgi:hypothetical protein